LLSRIRPVNDGFKGHRRAFGRREGQQQPYL
jgi:hypothetical protein